MHDTTTSTEPNNTSGASLKIWAMLAWRYPLFARHSPSNTRYVIAICLLLILGGLFGAVHAVVEGGAYLFVLEFARSIASLSLPRFESWSDAAWAIYATAMFAMLAPLFTSPTPEEKADFSTYRESLVVYAFGTLTLPGYPTSYLHARLARQASRIDARFALSGSNLAIQCLGRAASSSVQSLAYGVPLFFMAALPLSIIDLFSTISRHGLFASFSNGELFGPLFAPCVLTLLLARYGHFSDFPAYTGRRLRALCRVFWPAKPASPAPMASAQPRPGLFKRIALALDGAKSNLIEAGYDSGALAHAERDALNASARKTPEESTAPSRRL